MKNWTVRIGLVLVVVMFTLAMVRDVSTVANGSDYQQEPVNFNPVSVQKSEILPKDQVAGISEQVYLSVKLVDDGGMPISGHKIKLISSSGEDVIQALSEVSDSTGKVEFRVSSSKTGIVTYIAYDATSDLIISNRGKIVFFSSNEYIFSNNTNDFAFAAIGNTTSAIDHFEFENVPQQISPNQSVSFALSAVNAQSQPMTNYNGKVRFSVIGSNAFYADLPQDYSFSPQDLGSHTFSLALMFKQSGTYLVEARDLSNNAISGEYTFIVNGAASGTFGQSEISIGSPVAGTYSNNVQVVSGVAPSGSKVKIFDNDVEIATVISDISGNFSYTTSALTDGKHKFYAATANDVGTIISASNPVEITVDTGAPEVSNVVFEPAENILPGSMVKVKLFSKEKLSQAALVFQNNIYELSDSGQGFYQATIAAPKTPGEYSVSFVVVDQLGNETRLDNQAVLKVGSGGAAVALIGDVTALKVVSADHRVTLNWTEPTYHQNNIKNYRVYYGLSPTQLSEVVDTFTFSTTWYIPNLKNGTEYYFAVVAVDEKGNMSEHFSNIVSVVPNSAVGVVSAPNVVNGTAGEDMIAEIEKDPSDSGPGLFWMFILSFTGGFFYVRAGRIKSLLLES